MNNTTYFYLVVLVLLQLFLFLLLGALLGQRLCSPPATEREAGPGDCVENGSFAK